MTKYACALRTYSDDECCIDKCHVFVMRSKWTVYCVYMYRNVYAFDEMEYDIKKNISTIFVLTKDNVTVDLYVCDNF